MADAQDSLHLLCSRGQQDRFGDDSKICQRVAFVGAQLIGLTDQSILADDLAEFVKNLRAHGWLKDTTESSDFAIYYSVQRGSSELARTAHNSSESCFLNRAWS